MSSGCQAMCKYATAGAVLYIMKISKYHVPGLSKPSLNMNTELNGHLRSSLIHRESVALLGTDIEDG